MRASRLWVGIHLSFLTMPFTVVKSHTIRGFFALNLMAGILVSCFGPEKHVDDKIVWKDFVEIQEIFPRTYDKPLFLYINQSNCNYCDSMENVIFARPEIAWYMNEHFTTVNINVDEDLPVQFRQADGSFRDYNYAEFWNLFNIEGLPTYYTFDSTGKINGLLHAAQDVLTMKRFLVYVTAGHFGKTRWVDWLATDEANLDTLYGIF